MEVESKTAVPDEDWEVTSGGRRTYRVPEGRPRWAQPVDLTLPVISPRVNGLEITDGRAIHNSESADSSAVHAGDTNIAKIVTDPQVHQSGCAEHVVVRPDETKFAIPLVTNDPPIDAIHHSTTENCESANTGGTIDSVQHIVTDPSIHYSEAADYEMTIPKGTFVVPYSEPPIQEFQAATSAVETAAVPRIAIDQQFDNVEHSAATSRLNQRPPATTKVDGLNEDPWTIRRSYTYRKAAQTHVETFTRGRQQTKYSAYPTSSGSGRDSSYDPGQRIGGNRVGSTGRANVKYSDVNRKWPCDKAAVATGRKSDRGQLDVNRKFFSAGNSRDRNLMTSSVTTVLSPRLYSVHGVRSTVSLGAPRMITSAKPEPEIHRRLTAGQSRVGSLIVVFIVFIIKNIHFVILHFCAITNFISFLFSFTVFEYLLK